MSGFLMEYLLDIYRSKGIFVFNETEVRFGLRQANLYHPHIGQVGQTSIFASTRQGSNFDKGSYQYIYKSHRLCTDDKGTTRKHGHFPDPPVSVLDTCPVRTRNGHARTHPEYGLEVSSILLLLFF